MNQVSPFPDNLQDIANWISNTDKISSKKALQSAKKAFVDTIACILAASKEPVVERVFQGLRGSSGGVCTVTGRMETFSAENAALVNGTAAHALDFDDNFIPAVTHASAVMVPALLSLGEEIGATGDLLLDAYIVGLETQAWLGHHMIPAHYEMGWHATSTIGAVGAAAACIRLLTLDTKTISNAISLATSMASGSKVQFGTMAKPLHAGLASRAGITAAKLALAGVEASQDPFEGPWGFMTLFDGSHEPDYPRLSCLSILEHGLAQKKWPCCASAHRTLDAVYDLIRKHNLSAVEIEQIETVIPDSNCKNLRFDNPQNANEARFSMHYAVSVLVCTGGLTLEDFTDAAVWRPEIRQFMERVNMQSALAAETVTTSIWDIPARTTIKCRGNKQYTKSVKQPVGTIHAPLTDADLILKFMTCAGRLLSNEKSAQLIECLNDFQNQNIRHIASFMRTKETNRDRNIHQAVQELQDGILT
ncbi:MmgE/PrpD family protein [Sneathiella sp. P13V-1]|uniref:MmgE/PrpD family protein n=1 Tax=Sneathiella sp. P13V-1 TaxID=2697366 RepID=UPI00187B8C66|nr:MmgE/PrpD family protein [Sneathiella sp. P13V-1]MBE7637510.1 MmgE/PrpD family protein [Sneathiella sp. P13V-1]